MGASKAQSPTGSEVEQTQREICLPRMAGSAQAAHRRRAASVCGSEPAQGSSERSGWSHAPQAALHVYVNNEAGKALYVSCGWKVREVDATLPAVLLVRAALMCPFRCPLRCPFRCPFRFPLRCPLRFPRWASGVLSSSSVPSSELRCPNTAALRTLLGVLTDWQDQGPWARVCCREGSATKHVRMCDTIENAGTAIRAFLYACATGRSRRRPLHFLLSLCPAHRVLPTPPHAAAAAAAA